MASRLILVRHGMTHWNNERRYQGHTDIELNDEGIAQAYAVQRRLAATKLEAVYSSDLSRAYKTAQIIAEPHRLPVKIAPGLREINFGVWEGLCYEDLLRDYPDLLQVWFNSPHQLKVPEGETFQEVRDRAVAEVQKITAEHPLGNVILVSHGGTIAALICGLLEQPLSQMWQYKQKNTAVNILRKEGQKYVLELFNDVSHLS